MSEYEGDILEGVGVPEDIMRKARVIGCAMYEGEAWKHMRHLYRDGFYDKNPVVVRAALALLGERQQLPSKAPDTHKEGE